MKRIAYQYAILRFMPYVETGEFANVGLVMAAPQQGFFAYQLEEKRYGRLTRFFKDLEASTYLTAMDAMKKELCRLQQLAGQHKNNNHHLFEELIRPRETLFRFSPPSLVLTNNPKEQLKTLYGHYVEHAFVTPLYRKGILEKHVRSLLTQAQLANRYKQTRLGDEQYHITLPFVEKREGALLKAIQPLDLGQDETSKMLEKAGQWQFRLKELQHRNQLPNKLLFAVDDSKEQDTPQYEAYTTALSLLENTGAVVLPITQQDAILEFASY